MSETGKPTFVIWHPERGFIRSIGRDMHGYLHPLETKDVNRAKKWKTWKGAHKARMRVAAVWGKGYVVREASKVCL